MSAENRHRLLKRLILCFGVVQLVALVTFVALLGDRRFNNNNKSDKSSSRRLQIYGNGQWYHSPCTSGSGQYCWSWKPAPDDQGSSGFYWGKDNGDDAWASNDDAGWTHYDDLFHGDDDSQHDDGADHYDDQYSNDDYSHTDDDATPQDDDDFVYSYQPVPEASIINTPNGGYGGRRGRSLAQIRFNKCPPVIDGYGKTSWRYQPSTLGLEK
jgi:hypothetical protein